MSERVTDPEPFALPDVAIERGPLGASVTAFILKAQSHVVVIHGKLASGKTELVKRWVIPALQQAKEHEGCEVLYGDCTPLFPKVFMGPHGPVRFLDIGSRSTIVVIDSFDNVFDLPRTERRDVLDRLFEQVRRADGHTMVVLVTDSRHLTSVYALTSYDPSISDAVLEVKPIGIAEGLEQLSGMHPETAVSCTPDVLQALSADAIALEERGWDVTVDLIKLLDARFRRFGSTSRARSVERGEYERMGGLTGILRAHLEGRLDSLGAERPGSGEIGHAILEQVLEARAHSVPADFAELAPRLGVAPEQVQAVLARMVAFPGLLRQRGTGAYELMPPQLGAIVDDDLATRHGEDEKARRIVEEGLRSWQLLGSLLQRPRFEEVHRARAHLILDPEPIRFLLLCAIRLEGSEPDGASGYWLRRVGDRADAMDILLSSLFGHAREVRLRAAALLREFPEPDVRERLRILALTDADPEVRGQAIASLESMKDEALMQALMQDAQDPKSPHRAEAIDALRIFKDERVPGALQTLVNDPATELSLRRAAIHTLALLNMPQSGDALLAIALEDQDVEDRDAAAAALGSTQSPELNRHLLARLRATGGTSRIWPARIALSVIAVGFVALAIAAAGLFPVGMALLTVASVVLVLPMRKLLLGLIDQKVKRASVLGGVAVACYVLSALSLFFWIHGSAHLITRRWRRGLVLFGSQVLSIFLAMAVPSFSALLPAMGWFYFAAAVLFFVGSYIRDVVGVAFDTFVLTDTSRLANRTAAVYQQIFANPVAAGLVLDGLTSPVDVIWARELFRRFGRFAQPDQLVGRLKEPDTAALPLVLHGLRNRKTEGTVRRLEELWRNADRTLRWRIAGVLCSRPTERSLQALDKVRPDMGLMLRLRSSLAKWQFRFAVWPLAARVAALLLVPSAVVFVVHGFKASKDPVWSLIMSLRQPIGFGAQGAIVTQKMAIVRFLVANYPERSLEELRRLVRMGRYRDSWDPEWEPLHATVAQGLVEIQAQGLGTNDAELHEELLFAADRFADLLARHDSATFARSLGVLQTMAGARDPRLGDKAVRLLQGFVLRAPDTLLTRRMQAIGSLARLPYARALPALDSLLRVRPPPDLQREIRTQMGRVATQAYKAIPHDDLPREGRDLTVVLSKLKTPPLPVTNVRLQLEKAISEAERASQIKRCDLNGDGVCDKKDSALALVAERPMSEDGYRDLLNQYLLEEQYTDAEVAFARLKQRYPDGIWPRKLLAELYHEYLAPTDTMFFTRAYDEMAELRRLPAYRDLRSDTTEYYRFEADFVEIALSARHYGETERVAKHLIALTRSPVYRLNMTLMIYFAAVVQREPGAAGERLTQLEGIVKSLPGDFYNAWIYPGTLHFIRVSDLPENVRAALMKLCKSESWYEQAEGVKVLEENRSALNLLDRAASLE